MSPRASMPLVATIPSDVSLGVAGRLRLRLVLAVAAGALPLCHMMACSSTSSGGSAGNTSAAGGGGASGSGGSGVAAMLQCPAVVTCLTGTNCMCAIVCYPPGGATIDGGALPPLPCLSLGAPELHDVLGAVGPSHFITATDGPLEQGGQCCYVGVWPVSGRPLGVNGEARVGALVQRSDWARFAG